MDKLADYQFEHTFAAVVSRKGHKELRVHVRGKDVIYRVYKDRQEILQTPDPEIAQNRYSQILPRHQWE